ncbi:putative mitochondrial protein, partial [Mucuna pruriens]
MMELGKLKYFIMIEYVIDLLKETRKLGCKTLEVSIKQNHRIGCEESPIIEKSQCQRLVGKLIYLSHTRPDVAYAVSVISQFMHDPRVKHLQEVERIFQYLKASPRKGLSLEKKVHYPWRSVVDRRSTFEYCMVLGGNLLTWRSKKQNMVAQSSAEAEFRAMA